MSSLSQSFPYRTEKHTKYSLHTQGTERLVNQKSGIPLCELVSSIMDK